MGDVMSKGIKEKVRDAKAVPGACLRATERQVGKNGNPKKRGVDCTTTSGVK